MDQVAGEIKTLADMDAKLARASMTGQWQYETRLEKAIAGPKPSGVPFIWHWQNVSEMLHDACRVLPESKTARRTLAFNNPELSHGGTTHTLIAAIQIAMPGELAWAHRHSISALRFGIEGGRDLYTVVNGEALAMEPNDLVLTPPLCWHDHHNDGNSNGIWLDVLDQPLVGALNQISYAPLGERAQQLQVPRKDDIDYRLPLVRSDWQTVPTEQRPLRYPWSHVSKELSRFADTDGSPIDGVVLEYINPLTGGPALPTMSCNVQMLRPGLVTEEHRRSSSSICYVIEGSGTTVMEGRELNWGERDVFAVPDWISHFHVNRSKSRRAVLFVVNDAPLLKTMGLYREEATASQRPHKASMATIRPGHSD